MRKKQTPSTPHVGIYTQLKPHLNIYPELKLTWAGTKGALEAGGMEKENTFIPAAWRNPENLQTTQINPGKFQVHVVSLVLLVRLSVPSQGAEILARVSSDHP